VTEKSRPNLLTCREEETLKEDEQEPDVLTGLNFASMDRREVKKDDPYREYIMKHTFQDDIDCLILLESGKLNCLSCILNF
jgi:hypothetical protein